MREILARMNKLNIKNYFCIFYYFRRFRQTTEEKHNSNQHLRISDLDSLKL